MAYELPREYSIAKRIQQGEVREEHIEPLDNRAHLATKFGSPGPHRSHSRPAIRIHHHPETLADRMKRNEEIAAPVRVPNITNLSSRCKKAPADAHQRAEAAFKAAQPHLTIGI